MGQEVVDYGSVANDGTGDPLNSAFAKLDIGARLFGVLDKDLTAPPGGEAIGDAYIVGAAATGAWATHDGKIAVFGLGSTWLFVTAVEGMYAFVRDEDLLYRHTGAAWASQAVPMPIPLSYSGGPPTATEVMYSVMTTDDIYFPANFAGSVGYVGTNPTATFDIDVQDDGASIGTISVSTGGAFTFTTAGGTAKTVAAGSRVDFIAPGTPDATVEFILATLKGRAVL